jgi:hypothetical protein
MASPRSSQTAPGARRVPALLAACLACALTACAGSAPPVRLPAKSAAAVAHTALGRPTTLTPRQQVISALAGYVTALSQAEQSRSRAAARRILRPYLAADRIGGLVQSVSGIWARGDAFYGQDVLHVLSVRVERRRAFVHDCDNTSGMRLQYAASGQTVPGSSGVAHDNVVTRLELVRGRWQVESQLPVDVPCAP